jgi:hypothetical protein
MKGIVFTLLFLVWVSFSFAQEVAVDSKGEPVFQFYSKEDARLQFSRRAPVSASYLFNTKETTAGKFSGLLLQLSLLNSGDLPFIGKLRDVRPGAGIKIGYQNSIQAFNMIDQSQKGSVHAWGVNALFSVDNIKLYDTLKGIAGKNYPFTYGIEGNYSFFFRNKKASTKWKKSLSLYSFLGSTWNDRNLLSYQEITKVTLRPEVVALQDFDGRYGLLKKNFLKYRLAVSFPMFYGRLNPVPYWVAIFGTQNSPSYHIGVFTNILSSPLAKSNSKMPGSFGLGFDWVYATEHLSSKVNLFLKLAISFGKLKEE